MEIESKEYPFCRIRGRKGICVKEITCEFFRKRLKTKKQNDTITIERGDGMSKLVDMKINDKIIKIADVKHKYIQNIMECARDYRFIDKVVLFGSSLTEECNEDSDVDIAIFGNMSQAQCYRLKAYAEMLRKIYGYDFAQEYDILYFQSGKKYKDAIFEDVMKGVVLYERDDLVHGRGIS